MIRRRSIGAVEFVAVLLLSSFAGANVDKPDADSGRFLCGAFLRIGNLDGQLLERDDRFYKDVGLRLADGNPGDSSLGPMGASLGVDFEALYRLRPSLGVGLAVVIQSTTIHPEKSGGARFEGVLIGEQALMARLKYTPLEIGGFRCGIAGGLGWSLGTLHRFVFAKNNMDTIRSRILGVARPVEDSLVAVADSMGRYIELASRGLEVAGLRYEGAVVLTRWINQNVGAELRVGFHHSSFSSSGTDSLASMSPGYSFPVKAYGFEFSMGLFGSF